MSLPQPWEGIVVTCIDSEVWTCTDCGGTMIGGRTADDLCRSCLAAELRRVFGLVAS